MIKGDLVGLRAVEETDLKKLRDWRNIPELRRNFREVRELNMENQHLWYSSLQKNSMRDFMFVIERLSDNATIGACGLLYINWIIRSADFSFYIGENSHYIDQEGYGLEAAKLLIQYGFDNLNLNKIWMELYEFDLAKINFFKDSLNFSVDGKLRENCYEDGKYYDSLIISLLRKDYNHL